MVPADGVENLGLPVPGAGGLVQPQRLQGVVERVGVAALRFECIGQDVMCVDLLLFVADLAVEVEGVPQLGVGFFGTAEPGAGVGEVAVGGGPARWARPTGRPRRPRPTGW